MPEKTSTSSPSSPRRSSDGVGRGASPRLLCPPGLPGVSLALIHKSDAAQPRHIHETLTLGLLTAGARRIETPDCRAVVRAGEAFALPPGLAHGCAPENGHYSAIVFSIPPALLPEPLCHAAMPARLHLSTRLPTRLPDPELAQAISHLAEACETNVGALERQSLLACALERLATHVAEQENAACGLECAGRQAMKRAVTRARELLDAEEWDGWSLPALAEACGVEMYALHRAFTRITGLPPHTYQTHRRLRRAKALLRTGIDIAEAALAAGFCDQSHMHRHFTRLVGFTPAQYACAHRARSADGAAATDDA